MLWRAILILGFASCTDITGVGILWLCLAGLFTYFIDI